MPYRFNEPAPDIGTNRKLVDLEDRIINLSALLRQVEAEVAELRQKVEKLEAAQKQSTTEKPKK